MSRSRSSRGPEPGPEQEFRAGAAPGLGSGDGQFVLLDSSGIAVDADGNVYVADSLNHRIQKFDSEGVFLGKFGGRGTGLGEFNRPIDLTFSPDFSVLHVVEQASHRIQSLCMPGVPLATCRSQLDQDQDGLLDAEDNCPFRANLDQSDQDSDGVGDVCDNCLTVANPTQADAEAGTDDDSSRPGIQHYGNRCDVDLDGNGIVNTRDFFGGFRRCFGQTPSTTLDCAASDFNGDDRVNTLDFFGYFLPQFRRAPGPGISEP